MGHLNSSISALETNECQPNPAHVLRPHSRFNICWNVPWRHMKNWQGWSPLWPGTMGQNHRGGRSITLLYHLNFVSCRNVNSIQMNVAQSPRWHPGVTVPQRASKGRLSEAIRSTSLSCRWGDQDTRGLHSFRMENTCSGRPRHPSTCVQMKLSDSS